MLSKLRKWSHSLKYKLYNTQGQIDEATKIIDKKKTGLQEKGEEVERLTNEVVGMNGEI